MRENRTYGSEGGEARAFPTPITTLRDLILNDERDKERRRKVDRATQLLRQDASDRR